MLGQLLSDRVPYKWAKQQQVFVEPADVAHHSAHVYGAFKHCPAVRIQCSSGEDSSIYCTCVHGEIHLFF